MIGKKRYLGDSVYATYDGARIILTTENGLPDDPSNEIVIDSEVLYALEQFKKQIIEWIESVEKSILEDAHNSPPMLEGQSD